MGYLANILLPESKKRKLGSKTSDCMFIGYAEHNATYKFNFFRNDVLNYNTIIEIKNVEFFEYIFPLSNKIFHASIEINIEIFSNEELRRNKRLRKKIFLSK